MEFYGFNEKNIIKRGQEILAIVNDKVNNGMGANLLFVVDDFASVEPIATKYGWDCITTGINPETLDLYLIIKMGDLV